MELDISQVIMKGNNRKDTFVIEFKKNNTEKVILAFLKSNLLTDINNIHNFTFPDILSSRRQQIRSTFFSTCVIKRLGVSGSPGITTEVEDISVNGIGVKNFSYNVSKNTHVNLSFHIPDTTTNIETEAVIVNINKNKIGMKFHNTKKQQDIISYNLAKDILSHNSSIQETRRTGFRFPVQCDCKISLCHMQAINGTVNNISKTGISVKGIPPEYQGGVETAISIPNLPGEVNLNGQIVWNNKNEAGIQFSDELDSPLDILFNYKHIYHMQLAKVLQKKLKSKLPRHVVPDYFYLLDSFPRNQSGQVNEKELIKLATPYLVEKNCFKRLNEDEKKIKEIWNKTLNKVNNNFFHYHQVVDKLPEDLVNKYPLLKLLKFIPEDKSLATRKGKKEETTYYPLTHPQKRVWYSEQIYPESCIGNLFHSCGFHTKVNFKILKKAINLLVKNNTIMRLRIKIIDGNPVQYISPYKPFTINHGDFSGFEGKVKFKEWTEKKIAVPLFKEDADLFYFITVTFPDKKDGFFFGIHHMITDETGIAIIIKKIKSLYENLSMYKTTLDKYSTESLNFSYSSYIQYENEYKDSEKIHKDEKFWSDTLKDYTEPAFIKQFDHITDITAKRKVYSLSPGMSKKINEFCKKESTSIFRFFLAVLYVYLNRITNKTDIVIGSAFHNRFIEQFKTMIGMLVSTTPFRINISETNLNFLTLLQYIRSEIHDIKKHQEYPYDMLINKLNKEKRNKPIFDVLLNYHNMDFELPTEWHFPGTSNFPIVINISHRGKNGNLIVEIDYQNALFNESEIDLLYKHLINLLTNILKEPEKNMFKLEMLSDEEKNKILFEFNNTFVDYPKEKTIHQLFEEQVDRTPDNVAVVFMGKSITYKKLNEKANQIARILRKTGISPDDCVGILVTHSLEMIIGVMAILKAGAAFLPLDPAYPDERIQYILEESDTFILLTQKHLSNRTKGFSCLLIELDNNYIYSCKKTNLNLINKPDNLAYIIYTSGTTGNPKGIMIEHKSLVNLSCWSNRVYEVTENDRATKYAGFSFDASIWEIFPYLICGASLFIIDEKIKYDLKLIYDYLCKNKITICFLPTAMCQEYIKLDKYCESLRLLHTGGDKIRCFKKANYKICNNYGPAETTVIITNFILDKHYKNIPIGKPVDNNTIYIINKENMLQPIGIPGELCIAGENLARGYVKLPELTAQRFVENPFSPGDMMYKTGDIARWLPDGNIEFLGRNDFQIKIRGYRIEISEIETVIGSQPGVENTVVLIKQFEDDDKRLAAFIKEQEGNKVNLKQLKENLKKVLPDYMVPSLYAKIDSIPLNQNGKIDRKALDLIEVFPVEETHIKAKDNIEKQVAHIWQEILKLKNISIISNFYDLGGNSLKLIELSTRLKNHFKCEIQIVDLFKYPTIKKQAKYIYQLNKEIEVISCSEEKHKSQNNDIAVIGLAGRFPGASNLDEYWKNLIAGKESITFFTNEELLEAGIDPEILNDPSYVKAKGIIDNIEDFDSNFFGYTKKDAMFMDPQVRIFHEVVYTALENAGYVPDRFNGKIGIFAGASDNFYWQKLSLSHIEEFPDRFPLMILNKDFLSTRIAYKLNLKGPAYTVQTACSTSLVAVDVAVRSLLNDDCDMALAGGVSLCLPQIQGYHYKEGFTLSPDGHCRAFDAKAKGMIPGEGTGVVVLKKVSQAIKDKDTIWAVIKGSASNNDGSDKLGYTAPSINGQAEVIKKAIKRAGIDPETITYIEAHGTGTNLGDPVEIEGLKTAFNTTKKQFCRIGSVKTNIGHLDAAAGIAGLIKTVLMLHYKYIPPSLHFNTPNPEIDFQNGPFMINNKLIKWDKKQEIPLRAGVSSFGIGGTNSHVILEAASDFPEEIETSTLNNQYKLFLLSAKTENTLNKITKNLYNYLKKYPEINLDYIAYTLHVGRKWFNYRRMVIVQNIDEALNTLMMNSQNRNILTMRVEKKVVNLNEKTKKAKNLIKEIRKTNTVAYNQLYELGKLWCNGISFDWEKLYINKKQKRIPIPTYPFERNRYWIEKIENNLNLKQLNKLSGKKKSDHKFIKKSNINEWFYQPQWIHSVPPNSIVSKKIIYLIFLDDFGIGNKIARALKEKKHTTISIKKGVRYSKINKNTYTINPRNEKDYKKLFLEINEDKHIINRIIHLFSICNNYDISIKSVENALELGFNSLLNIVRNINNSNMINTIKLFSITNDCFDVYGDRNINVGCATILGAVKTIPLEYDNISCANIDIKVFDILFHKSVLLNQIVNEVMSECNSQIVAYRDNYRWIKEYRPIKYDTIVWPKKVGIKEKGVYLITGGLGGIGFTIAKELVKEFQARLIIISGRSPLPDRIEWDTLLKKNNTEDVVTKKIKRIKHLETFNSEIYVAQADVSDRSQLKKVIREGLRKFKRINGIIHSAGIADGKMIQSREKNIDQKVLTAKIAGTLILNNLCKDMKLDFFILCSSLTSVIGTVGQAGYCAANIFLNSFADFARKKSKFKVISVNWDAWKDIGMSIKLQERLKRILEIDNLINEKNLIKTYLDHCITSNEGIEIFYRILEMNLPQIAVSTIDLNNPVIGQMNQSLITLLSKDIKAIYNNIKHNGIKASNYTIKEIKDFLIVLWQKFLGTDKIKIEDDFFKLGGDSLLAIQMIPEINKQFNINLSHSAFLNIQTIKDFSKVIYKMIMPTYELKQISIKSIPHLIQLKSGCKKYPPIFLIHPVSGTVYFYHDLSLFLSSKQSVYGIEAQGVDGKEKPLKRIEEMAAKYINIVHHIQPYGPYYIGGSSLGGCIAYEMALQLHKQNEDIGAVIMIDTPGPKTILPGFKDDAEILSYFLSYNNLNYQDTLSLLRSLSEKKRLNYFLTQNNLYQKILYNKNSLENLKNSIQLTLINSEAMNNYFSHSLHSYKGTILFFSATRSSCIPVNLEKDWEGFFKGDCITYKIPGNHIAINFSPQVKIIAKYIQNYLCKMIMD